MPRTYVPHGVIPAVLLPFDNDLAIDEAGCKHLRDGCRRGLSAITSTPIRPRSAPSTDERVLDIAQGRSAPVCP